MPLLGKIMNAIQARMKPCHLTPAINKAAGGAGGGFIFRVFLPRRSAFASMRIFSQQTSPSSQWKGTKDEINKTKQNKTKSLCTRTLHGVTKPAHKKRAPGRPAFPGWPGATLPVYASNGARWKMTIRGVRLISKAPASIEVTSSHPGMFFF